MGIENDYKLIPMNEIESEAREIAVRWGGDSGMDWIGDKHKLASDIMNYARRQLEKVGINRPITIDDKEGVITKIDKLPTGIVLVYIDFDKPNPHWKIYTIDEVIKVVGSSGAVANVDTGERQLTIPDVIKSVCVKCLYYLTCRDVNRDKQRCQLYDDEP